MSRLQLGQRSQRTPVASVPLVPTVNLLPPEVVQGRRVKAVRRQLGLALGVVLLVCAAVYGWAQVEVHQASSQLDAANRTTASLVAQQHQYDEVPRVLQVTSSLKSARTYGFATDINWPAYLTTAVFAMPPGVGVEGFKVTTTSPVSQQAASTDPLVASGVAQVALSLRSTTVPEAGDIIDRLDAIPGFVDATVSEVTRTEDDEDGPYYHVVATVQVTTDALDTHRFGDDATKG